MSLIASYRNLPRAGQWGVLACVGLIAYFAVIEPSVEFMGDLSRKADLRTEELASFSREGQTGERARANVAVGIAHFGEVAGPGDSDRRVEAFNRTVADILAGHGVKDTKATGRRSSMSKGPLLTALGTGAAVSREFSDLQFEATPEQVTGIIADLENAPEVAGVSRVQLRRVEGDSGARLLRVNLSVETWVIQRKGGQS